MRSSEAEGAFRPWTVLAQDPSITTRGAALTTQVLAPNEHLEAGPRGHRVHVIDFDAGARVYYTPRKHGLLRDPYANITDLDKLVRDPHFHQQNVYAIAMSTLSEFERALGRSVCWGFDDPSHELKIAPHAFADANAYYSRRSESLAFGYFRPARNRLVYTCLSHEIIAHETTHAILDGLRNFFMRPSSPDQAAFHEGFADVVALLSVFKGRSLIEHSLAGVVDRRNLVPSAALTWDALADNVLMRLAKELGEDLAGVRGEPLRHSVKLKPSRNYLTSPEYVEAHKRGEVLVAIMMHAFLEVWVRRLDPIGRDRGIALNRSVVAEEGAVAARQLLRVAIRALDYLPPVDMDFSSYLSALLTADAQAYPDDTRYRYREALTRWFGRYGVDAPPSANPDGTWEGCEDLALRYDRTHLEQIQREPEVVFRFICENRAALAIERDAFTRVISVRPCVRVGSDGVTLRETVAEYVQTIKLSASQLVSFKIKKPKGLSNGAWLTLYGGGSLIFDEYGRLKFHIGTGVRSERQNARLESLFQRGYFSRGEEPAANFAALHRRRMRHQINFAREQW
jgi:hypothetical protein